MQRAWNAGRTSLELATLRAIEALDAIKVEFVKDEAGFVPVGEVPDWPNRLKAAQFLADRFGLPKQSEVTREDPFKKFMDELAKAAEPEDR